MISMFEADLLPEFPSTKANSRTVCLRGGRCGRSLECCPPRGGQHSKLLPHLPPRRHTVREFAFVEGNSGSKSASNIEIIDVYDFGIDRKEEKMPLKDYLDLQPVSGSVSDAGFLSWTKEDCHRIVNDRDGHTGVTGTLMGWFKRQYAS